jgi:hypothetical protein
MILGTEGREGFTRNFGELPGHSFTAHPEEFNETRPGLRGRR